MTAWGHWLSLVGPRLEVSQELGKPVVIEGASLLLREVVGVQLFLKVEA